MSCGVIGLKPQGLLAGRYGFLVSAKLAIGKAQIRVRPRIIRFEPDSPFEGLNSLVVASEFGVDSPYIGVGLDKIRLEMNGLFIRLDGFSQAINLLVGKAQVIMSRRVVGHNAYGLLGRFDGVFIKSKS